MKKTKNNYIYGRSLASKSDNKKKSNSLCRSIAEEKLAFKDGAEQGSLSIGIEDGATKRMVRRIVKKRVCKEYWKLQKKTRDKSNKHRAATGVVSKFFRNSANATEYRVPSATSG